MKLSHEHHEHHHEVHRGHHHDCSCSTEEHEHQGCGCHHHHHHEEGSLKSKLFLIGATIILLIIAVFIEKNYDLATWQLLLVYLIPYLLIGHETLGEAAEGGRTLRRICGRKEPRQYFASDEYPTGCSEC